MRCKTLQPTEILTQSSIWWRQVSSVLLVSALTMFWYAASLPNTLI